MKPSEAIEQLLALDMTEAAIGDAVGARQSTINKIKREDMQPNYTLGKALVDLAELKGSLARQPPAANEGDAASADGTQIQPLKAA